MQTVDQEYTNRVTISKDIIEFEKQQAVQILSNYTDKKYEIEDKNDKKTYAKFYRTCKKTSRRNLSSTAICTYVISQYQTIWNQYKEIGFGKNDIGEKESYWNHLIKILTEKIKPMNIEAPDEFTILNVTSLLGGIIEKEKLSKEDRAVLVRIIRSLCIEYIENHFVYREKGVHPFLYYKFLKTLQELQEIFKDNLKEEIETKIKEKYGKDVPISFPEKKYWYLEWFYDKIYDDGKYELYRQIALHSASDGTLFDVKRLVYSLLIVTRQAKYSNNLITSKALEIIFNDQLVPTGLLPICHVVDNDFVMINTKIKPREVSAVPLLLSFECFTDMLSEKALKEDLKAYEPRFRLAYEWTNQRLRRDLNNKPIGWFTEYESNHVAESWVAAHVLLFLMKYNELLESLINP